jgi:KDO2-lipid IV(A) lauroyltransferase
MKKEFEYGLIWFVVRLIKLLPLSLARRLADLIAFLLYNILSVRKQVTLENLRRAFPDWDFPRRYQTGKDCYRFYARSAVEWLKTDDILAKGEVEVEGDGAARLNKYAAEGAIIATGHIGYWELIGVLIARRFGEINVYADEQSNPYSQKMINRNRGKYNISTYTGGSGVRQLVKAANKGKPVGVVADQRPRGKSLYVPFFNRYVQNTRIPALLARQTGLPVLPVFAIRTAADRISVFVEPPLETSLEPPGEQDEIELISEYNSVLEKYIKRYPEQYFWLHRRWKNARGSVAGVK